MDRIASLPDGDPVFSRDFAREDIVALESPAQMEARHSQYENLLCRRDKIFAAIAQASTELLTAPDIDAVIPSMLACLGEAVDASRVYVFENRHNAQGELLMSQRYEWCARGIDPQIDNPHLQNLPYASTACARWKVRLGRGRAVSGQVRDFPSPEREELAAQRIRSLLVVPIFTRDGWWGFMGFDECRHERDWAPAEIDALKSVAAALGAAVVRARTEEELLRVNRELERHIERRTRALQEEVIERGRSEEVRLRLATAVECAAELIVVTKADGTIIYVNPAFERVTGYLGREAVGRTPALLQSGQHDPAFYKSLWDTISAGGVWTGRFVNKRADGTLYREDATISPIFDASGGISGYVAVSRDVTHEAELETQLRQAQKLEAIGTLAGGIAHDFNNILSAVLGFTELAILDLDSQSQTYACLQQVIGAGRRAADLVRQILTFSRETEQEYRPVRLQPVCKEALRLLRGTLPSTIEIHSRIDERSDSVMADATQIHQVLMNLCTNAYQAMREQGGGVLQVSYEQVGLSPTDAEPLGIAPGPHVRLMVSDTGCGMDEATRKRIFEPYFTTKKHGEGTGLGLATTHGIVLAHHGAITVESVPGQGTTFVIYLPACDQPEQPVQALPEAQPFPQGSERILFVDDEEPIVDMATRALERMGYRVTAFTDSARALEEFRRAPDAFDLVITDLTMPRLPGLELATEIRSLAPALPIILCSGFVDSLDDGDLKRLGIQTFVEKPIIPRDLAQTIRDVIDRRPEAR